MGRGIRLRSSAAGPSAGRAWTTLSLGLALGAVVAFAATRIVGGLDVAPLDWQPALAWRQPWRAWTAVFVHLSTLHLLANLLGAALVAALGVAARVPRHSVVAWLLAWPATQFALLVRPDLLHYAGLSGVLHAGVAVVGVHLAAAGRDHRRWIGAAVLAGLAVKVAGESPWGAAIVRPAGWDIAIAPAAHAGGLLAGALASLVAESLASRSRRKRR